jgi:aspartyl-tRNA(Asn)/glutamyl-tRNA(Gln) amidotransferase subunit A
MQLHELPVIEAGRRLRQGTLTSVALTQHALQRIARMDNRYHAFTRVLAGRALTEAEVADAALQAGNDRGPLHGIPYAVKDVIDVQGVATTCASRLRQDHIADQDADCVQVMKAAGAVLIGKLMTYEFATVGPSFDLVFLPAINPNAPDRITGGSSSGCAAAVAAGFVRMTIGTDGGGSARSPASYCGVVGVKPSYGQVSCRGIYPLAPSLDHVGIIAATVAEAALGLDVLCAKDSSSERGQGVTGLRIGYARHWSQGADEDVQSALDNAAEQLRSLGASVKEVTLPPYDLFEACGTVIIQAEAYAQHASGLRQNFALYGSKTRQNLATGVVLDADDVAAARAAKVTLTQLFDQAIKPFDALLLASTLTPAPPVSEFQSSTPRWTEMRTFPFNVTGNPALAMPSGRSSAGLPLGLQIVGHRGDEPMVSRVAQALETALQGQFTFQFPQ